MADMDEEDLDYHITFPSNVSHGAAEEVGSDEEDVTSDQEEPVMILLGWAGCKDKHLSKYSAIYNKRCITIRYTAPTGDVFYKPHKLRMVAVKILEILTDMQLTENPVFFHVFSNGGGMVYRHISELMHTDREYMHMRMVGTIFDSCPSQRNLWTASKAMMATMKNWNIIFRYTAAIFVMAYLLSISFVGYFKSKINGKSKDSSNYFTAIKNDPAGCPQLYLYSKADEIVSYIAIEDQIRHRELKVKVESVCWEDSAHVAHFKLHRESYMKHCQDFLNMCLESLL